MVLASIGEGTNEVVLAADSKPDDKIPPPTGQETPTLHTGGNFRFTPHFPPTCPPSHAALHCPAQMKSEHRHELKSNDLAKSLLTFQDYVKVYGGRVFLGLAIVVLIIVLIIQRSGKSQAEAQKNAG